MRKMCFLISSKHSKYNIYKRTNVMQLGSMFICNCNIAVHISDAFCVHLQEHLETVETDSGEWHALYIAAYHSPEAASTVSKSSWRWTQKASETCRAILQLQINILPSCITLLLLYILTYDARKPKHKTRNTVEPGYNDIGLSKAPSITSYVCGVI